MRNWLWMLSAIGLLTVGCGDLQASGSSILPPPVEEAEGGAEAIDMEQDQGNAEAEPFDDYKEAEITQTANSSKPLTRLEIRYETPSLEGVSLSRGPVDVRVSYTAREDITEENRPLLRYEIFHNGELKVEDSVIAVDSGNVLIGDFDQDGGMEVGIQAFTGGANCCLATTVYSWNSTNFDKLSLDETIGGEFEDIDGDGSFEFVTIDSNFLAKFSSYAGSVAPPMIFSLTGSGFVESTQNYPDYLYAEIADLEQRNWQMDAYSLLAAYVANKSLVGESESAWAYMLDRYSGTDPEYGSGMNIYDEDRNLLGRHDSFPDALEAFLIEQGYW